MHAATPLALGIVLVSACESASPGPPRPRPAPLASAPAPSATATLPTVNAVGASRPRFILPPHRLDAVEPFIQEQVELSAASGARTLVYVGAPWCEPCQRFHAAVVNGELDTLLAGAHLLEFDADQYRDALHRAGYAYEFVPVIAIPGADGRSSGRILSGSIAGPSAVPGDLVPRLRALLAGRAVE
ncbi:MAG TPA: thioredoxin [Polyangiaceae bacterium]|nr:thioredoxin [Polyangiaceae bacterium]